jgi:hypothetical protein
MESTVSVNLLPSISGRRYPSVNLARRRELSGMPAADRMQRQAVHRSAPAVEFASPACRFYTPQRRISTESQSIKGVLVDVYA